MKKYKDQNSIKTKLTNIFLFLVYKETSPK